MRAVHGLPTVVTTIAASHVAPAPLSEDGRGDAWSHQRGRYVPVRVALIANKAADFANAVLQVSAQGSQAYHSTLKGYSWLLACFSYLAGASERDALG